MPVPVHVRDLVTVELKRVFPDGLAKHELQEVSGLGSSDLREVVQELGGEGLLEETEDGGFRLSAKGYDPETADDGADGFIGQPIGGRVEAPEEEPEPAEEEDALPDFPLDEPEQVTRLERTPLDDPEPVRYAVTVALEVNYFPELRPPETPDEAAVREGLLIAEKAEAGVLAAFPDLPIMCRVIEVQAFDNPRTVYPS
jgi:hypothetical protein